MKINMIPLYINICFGFCLKKSPTNGDNKRVTISAIPITDISQATCAVVYFRSSNIYGIIKVKFISEKSVNETANIEIMNFPLCNNLKSKLSTIQLIIWFIIGRFVSVDGAGGSVTVESFHIQIILSESNCHCNFAKKKPSSAAGYSFSDSFNLSSLFSEIVAIYL